MSTERPDSAAQRVYVKAQIPIALHRALYDQFRGPLYSVGKAAAGLSMAVIALALLIPFLNPVRKLIGGYLYVHIFVVAVVVVVFFGWVVPPARRATEGRRLRFLDRAKDKCLQSAGLDGSGIASTRIEADGRTLAIVVTEDWLSRPREVRLRDAQYFWWLWTTVFLPDGGADKVFVRLLDSSGSEVGGSHREFGSQIWAR